METKIEKKSFGVAEFNEEENWLEEQHRNGWSIIKSNGSKYQFERCEADEWVYQLDFKENGKAEDAYIQMFIDCGWEFVLQRGKWFYFRKRKDADVDLTIFSDRISRIDMYTRVLKSRHLQFTIALFAASCVIVWLSIFTKTFSGDTFWDGALPWVGAGLFVATSFSFFQYTKLRKMVEELKLTE